MSRITDTAVQRQAVSALYSHDASGTAAPSAVATGEATRDSDTISIRSRHTLRAFNDADDTDPDDAWSAIPRRHPVPATAAVMPLPRAERNRLLLRALLQLVSLFVVCTAGLAATLYLALPVISPEDKSLLHVPRNFDDLQHLNSILQRYKSAHFGRVLFCWIVVYMFLQAFSIPGSMYMSILAGALFGVPLALPLVCCSVATGASICYLISKFLGVVLIALPTWQKRVDEWKAKLAEHNDNLVSYLIVIRMMPLPPHNIVNILAPHLGIGLGVFWLSTAGGIFAVSLIHVTLGEKLDQMTSADDFQLWSVRNVVLLAAVMVAVLLPVGLRRWRGGDALESSEEGRGEVFLPDDQDEHNNLPSSFRTLSFPVDSDDDELPPHHSLDTTHITATAGVGLDANDSFPTWTTEHGVSDDEDEARNSSDYGRGGIFRDRDSTAPANGQAGNRAKLKKWIAGSTGIQL